MDDKQALYAALVEGCPDAIIVADRKGVICFWNGGAESLFGYPAQEAVGQTLDLIIPPALRQRHWDGYNEVMRSGRTRYGHDLLKVPATHRDGRRMSIEFKVALLHHAGGEMTGIAAYLRDATAAWQERQALLKRVAELEGKE